MCVLYEGIRQGTPRNTIETCVSSKDYVTCNGEREALINMMKMWMQIQWTTLSCEWNVKPMTRI